MTPQTTYPKLRADLIISRQQTPGGVVFILKDPRVGRFVRFKEPEYFIAQQLDGATPLAEVRRRGEEHLDAPLAQATLEAFTAKLQTLGLLENGAVQLHTGEPDRKSGRVRGNMFALRFQVFDP